MAAVLLALGCVDRGASGAVGTTGDVAASESGTSTPIDGESADSGTSESSDSGSSGDMDPGPSESQCAELPEAENAAWRAYVGDAYEDDPHADLADVGAIVDAHTRFGLELYQTLAAAEDDDDGNLVISPYSIHTAMAMAYPGARGNMAREIAETMHFDALPDERLHVAMNRLQLDLAARALPESEEESAVELALANSVWIDGAFPHEQTFVDTLTRNYDVELFALDFMHSPEPSRAILNCWVEERTRGRIETLFPEMSITEDARVVLTNALYLLAPWATAFDEELTRDESFTRADGTAVDVPTMHAVAEHPYFGDAEVQALELPLRGGELSMVLMLPAGDVDAFATNLDGDRLAEIIDGLAAEVTDVAIPKFEFRYGTARLDGPLQALGIHAAFDCCGGAADFSGISSEYLFIHGVYHQTFIAVDERGVEAAAAAGVVIGVGFIDEPDPEPTATFHADRPFLVAIRDRSTDAILFFGRVTDP